MEREGDVREWHIVSGRLELYLTMRWCGVCQVGWHVRGGNGPLCQREVNLIELLNDGGHCR
jgi:hypothetical protein